LWRSRNAVRLSKKNQGEQKNTISKMARPRTIENPLGLSYYKLRKIREREEAIKRGEPIKKKVTKQKMKVKIQRDVIKKVESDVILRFD